MTDVQLYRNQFIDLQGKSMDWFLCDSDLRHERVKARFKPLCMICRNGETHFQNLAANTATFLKCI